MDFKRILKESKIAFILEMCLLALVTVGLLVFAAMSFLKSYTRHGDEVVVPDFGTMYIEEAQVFAKNQGLSIQVIDSVYSRRVALGAIMEQNPVAGSRTKNGRPIYVTINAKQLRQVPLPAIQNISYRQAEATLRTVGLEIAEVEFEPSVYRDLVLDVRCGGKSISAGTRLSEGTKVTLVIGQGSGTEEVVVPLLLAKTVAEARAALMEVRLTLGALFYDVEPNGHESEFVVYKQSQPAGNTIMEGERIDIYLTTDLDKAAQAQQSATTDEFFD